MLMKWLHRAQPMLVVVSLLLIVFLLRNQWELLRAQPWRLHPGWLALSGIFLLLAWSVEVNLWRWLLAVVGGRLAFGPAWRIWFITALVRYLPGSIWQPLSMTLYCQHWHIRPESTLMSMVLYQVIALLAVMPFAILYLVWGSNAALVTQALAGFAPGLIALGLAPVLIFLLKPDWLLVAVNWALRKAGREPLDARLSRSALAGQMALGSVSWFFWGLSFAALTLALRPYSFSEMVRVTPVLVAAFPIGYAIGFLSLITPSGFGVREGAYYLLLVPLLDAGTVTVAALVMRFWIILAEVLMAGIAALVMRRAVSQASSQPYPPATHRVAAVGSSAVEPQAE
jgi:glycosyltransferase 2 family protein